MMIFPVEFSMRRIQMLKPKSIIALIFMFLSTCVYAYSRISSVSYIGICWGLSYTLCTCFSMVVQNMIANQEDGQNPMVLTLYTNQISTLFMFAMLSGNLLLSQTIPKRINFTPLQLCAISLSCVLGASISYLGWKCQKIYSAMYLSIVNASSKILVIVFNRLINRDEIPWTASVAIVVYFTSVIFFRTEKIRDEEEQHLVR